MKPLDVIYAVRAILGALTALICLFLRINDIIVALAIASLIYLLSDKVLRQIFIGKVDRSEVTRTGIGIFFITWIFLWILMYTFMKSFFGWSVFLWSSRLHVGNLQAPKSILYHSRLETFLSHVS